MSALVEVMAWLRTVDKPLSETMMVSLTDAYMRHTILQWDNTWGNVPYADYVMWICVGVDGR